jgi:hypothetical protein
MKIFRQPRLRDWDTPMENVAKELNVLVKSDRKLSC